METISHCHSCGADVSDDARRCPSCYVALGAASRAPSPLRAAPSAAAPASQLALAPAPVLPKLPPVVRCPACETTVLAVTGWCSYCMDPLPADGPTPPPPELTGPEQAGPLVHLEVLARRSRPSAAGSDEAIAYARWHQRALAALIDAAVFLPGLAALALSVPAGGLLLVAAAIFTIWQIRWAQARTGQTVGQNRLGIFLPRQPESPAPNGPKRRRRRRPLTTSGREGTSRCR